jgi:deoxyguanosine kinase
VERYNHLTIEGNIGSGKTSLSKMISERFNAKLVLEEFDENPFLPKFYEKPDKYAFPLELSFLAERYHQLKNAASGPGLFHSMTVSDYFIGKSLIFAKNNLDEDELKLFNNIFEIMFSSLPKPDLIVYLHVGIERLHQNIKKRGRSYENSIKSDYLEGINAGYVDFFKKLTDTKVLILDLEQINFVEKKEHFDRIIDVIDREYSVGMHFESLVE